MQAIDIIYKKVRKIYDKVFKPTIFCLVGESGSGKTWVAQEMVNNGVCPTVVSYTTRPMRTGETNGVEHWFTTTETYDRLRQVNPEDIAAYTFFGGAHYWTTHSQMKDLGPYFTYVVDEKGVEYLQKYSDRYNIVTIKIERPVKNDIDQDRKDRDNGMFVKDNSEYTYVVRNDSTLEKFYLVVSTIIKMHVSRLPSPADVNQKLQHNMQKIMHQMINK